MTAAAATNVPQERDVLAGRRGDVLAVLTIVVMVIAVRSPALLLSVADYDESLYLLVARDVLAGHLPYLTVWETKPPLFFFLIAAWSKIFGLSIVSYRFLADAAVAVTALAIYRIGAAFEARGRLIGFTAALTYAGLTVSDSGTASEAEIFIAPFITLAAANILPALAARTGVTARTAFCAGLFLGCATQIKESAGLEALYVGVLGAILLRRNVGALAALIFGAVVPVVLDIVPYAVTSTMPAYLDANLWSLLRRTHTPSHPPYLDVVRQQAEALFPSIFLAAALPQALRHSASRDRRLIYLLVAWCVIDLVTVAGIREFLAYQFLPVMVPLSVISAWTAVRLLGSRASLVPAALSIAIGIIVIHDAGQLVTAQRTLVQRYVRNDRYYGDDTMRIAAYLDAHRGTGKWLYVARDEPVLYFLTGAPVPTRFPFPPHLIQPEQEQVAGTDGAAEIRRIFSRKPRYVVFDGPVSRPEDAAVAVIAQNLRTDYDVVFSVDARRVYCRHL
ncbi:MAG TPA: glycosyltransferase family 39 protein [Candidatus Acidoferrales bacterium]|nr:glycosyltransferase family 39 protein [Candidatus Acidoferrales bacterium]